MRKLIVMVVLAATLGSLWAVVPAGAAGPLSLASATSPTYGAVADFGGSSAAARSSVIDAHYGEEACTTTWTTLGTGHGSRGSVPFSLTTCRPRDHNHLPERIITRVCLSWGADSFAAWAVPLLTLPQVSWLTLPQAAATVSLACLAWDTKEFLRDRIEWL